MNKIKTIFLALGILLTLNCSAQMKAIYFNADWNKANHIDWFTKLNDVQKETMDVSKGDCQKQYKIAVIPTIIIMVCHQTIIITLLMIYLVEEYQLLMNNTKMRIILM